jgi:hypothetical protein
MTTTVFRSDGRTVEDAAGVAKPEVFAAGDTDQTRAEQLGRMQATLQAAASGVGRRGETRIFEVATGTGGAELRLEHRLGRVARWSVVDWRRTTPGGYHGLERLSSDENTLVLRSYVAGTASIEVW